MTALALDGTSPLDLGAVTEVFGIDRGLAPRWYGTIFVRYPGRTEVARPEDIRALLERHVTPFREAYDLARCYGRERALADQRGSDFVLTNQLHEDQQREVVNFAGDAYTDHS